VIEAPGRKAPPVQLALAFGSERLRRDADVDLDLTVTALRSLPRVWIVLRLPSEVRLTGGSPVWEGPLSVDAARRMTVRVRVGGRTRFTLGASAEILEGPYAGQVAGAVLYVDATREEIRWSREPLDG
jgi:hypothetical protein